MAKGRVAYFIENIDYSGPATRALLVEPLHRATFPDYDMVDVWNGHWWLAWSQGKPVAFAGMWSSRSEDSGGYLCRAGVVDGHRGRGLQRRLIRARERKARALGWRVMFTDTLRDNAASANNLIACGYRVFLPKVPWGGPDAVYWRKALS